MNRPLTSDQRRGLAMYAYMQRHATAGSLHEPKLCDPPPQDLEIDIPEPTQAELDDHDPDIERKLRRWIVGLIVAAALLCVGVVSLAAVGAWTVVAGIVS